jgi:hypothetical protein
VRNTNDRAEEKLARQDANRYAVALLDTVPEDGAPETHLVLAGQQAKIPNPAAVLQLLIDGGLFDRKPGHRITRGPRYEEVRRMIDAEHPPCPQCHAEKGGRGARIPDGAIATGHVRPKALRPGRAWFRCWRKDCNHAFPAEVGHA